MKRSSASRRSPGETKTSTYRHSDRTVRIQRSALPLVWGRYGRVRLWRRPSQRRARPKIRLRYPAPLSVRSRRTAIPWARNQRSARARKRAVVRPRSSGSSSAYTSRVAASIATWRISQPIPRCRLVRTPVARWPGTRADPPELLRVEMEQAAGLGDLVADDRLADPDPREVAQPAEDPVAGRGRQVEQSADPVGSEAGRLAQAGDLALGRDRHPLRAAARSGAPVDETRRARGLPARQPAVVGAPAHPEARQAALTVIPASTAAKTSAPPRG